ncbi:hypothetical protein [Shewanella gaetbuli]
MKKGLIHLLLVSLLAAPAFAAQVYFPIPAFFKLHVVADKMEFNSVTMSISGFNTSKSAAEIYAFYHKEWHGEINSSAYGDWTIYSHIKDGILYTVQFKQQQLATLGFIALSNLPGVQSSKLADLGEGFPMPQNTLVANDIKANDAGRMSRVLLLTNKHSVNSNFKYYQRTLTMQGWIIQHQQPSANNKAGLVLAKNNTSLNIVIVNDGNLSNIQVVSIEN